MSDKPDIFVVNASDVESTRGEVRVCADAAVLARAAAELFVGLCAESINARGRFRVALSGGSTPRKVYELLATGAFKDRVEWARVDVFWGDERYVPADDRESNYRMAADALLRHVPIPAANIHRVRTELSLPSEAAESYEKEIRQCLQNAHSVPEFDLIYLGLGTNGHTASLFPHSQALQEKSRLVVADFVAEVNMWRITMTVPVLNSGRVVAFLVEGQNKAEVLRQVLVGAREPETLPARLISPEGKLLWIVDEAAAARLPRKEERRSA